MWALLRKHCIQQDDSIDKFNFGNQVALEIPWNIHNSSLIDITQHLMELKSSLINGVSLPSELNTLNEKLPAVRVKGNEVRVIIDASNYAALFTDPKLQEGIAKLLAKTQLKQKRAALRP